jgi:hypothetical protein
VQAKLREDYYVIVFSHYPIYCSNIYDDKQSCEVNIKQYAAYRKYFDNSSMDLYLSGHLHLYERTKPICADESYKPVTLDDVY